MRLSKVRVEGPLFSGDTLSDLLYAFATGFPDRAKNIVYASDELHEHERERLRPIVDDDAATPGEQARRLGDALRELGAHRDLPNECYRLSFYLSEDLFGLSENPLFAYFLAHRTGRLLDKWPHYFAIYHRHLAAYRNRGARVLEIGVFHGASLDMWSRYFGTSTTLVGVDIDDAALRLADPTRTILVGDQANPDFLADVVEQHGPFDVVIDDGGHTMEQQIIAVESLFPGLRDSGTYLVEDCHTSYWEDFGGGRGREGTFIEWVKGRIDDLHGYHLTEPVDPLWTVHVDGIHCYDSLVVLEKRRRTPPFSEQAGTSDFIHHPRPASTVIGEMLATRDAAIRHRTELEADLRRVELELTSSLDAAIMERTTLEAHLRRVEDELTATRNDLLESWDQTQAMRRTISWRITAPLRRVRRLMHGR